jgi:Na+-driven multidrug efflux pump
LLVGLINEDVEVIAAAAGYLAIAPFGMGAMGVMQNSVSSFNALGKPMPPLLISILQMIVIGLPVAIAGDYLFGYRGIFAGIVFTVFLMSALSWFWLRHEIAVGIMRRTAPGG